VQLQKVQLFEEILRVLSSGRFVFGSLPLHRLQELRRSASGDSIVFCSAFIHFIGFAVVAASLVCIRVQQRSL
jgi:hypothetical protein